MRNILFYILLICAVTHNFAQNEGNELLDTETNKLTKHDFEEEARSDIENLLKSIEQNGGEDEIGKQTINTYEPRSFTERNDLLRDQINNLLKQLNMKSRGGKNQAIPVKGFKGNNNLFKQRKKKFHLHRDYKKNKVSQNNVYLENNNVLRKDVNHGGVQPEVYPVSISEDKYVNINKAPRKDGQLNKLNLKQSDNTTTSEKVMRTRTISTSENNDEFYELLRRLYNMPKNKLISTREGSNSNNRLHNLVKKQSRNRNKLTMIRNDEKLNKKIHQLCELVQHLDIKHKVQNKANGKNFKISDQFSDNNGTFHQLLKKLDIKHGNVKRDLLRLDNSNRLYGVVKNWDLVQRADQNNNRNKLPDVALRTLQETVTYNNKPIPTSSPADGHDRRGSRPRRSTYTQAGYTQDLDTCKTYNENLVKLWLNLSKYINVTEQPNDKALHNIALMIQAYLEHQNIKQRPDSHKVKHEGTRDKVSEVIAKIKKMLDENDDSSERITKIIIKYLKPFYGDIENGECQKVNEEFLGSSVELLYKNYMENDECLNDGDGTVRNKQQRSLGKHSTKKGKSLSNGPYKPEIKSILSKDEHYNDFHRGKMTQQRSPTEYRRVFKRSRKLKSSSSSYRSRDQNMNGGEKRGARSKVSHKSNNNKLKRSSLKSNVEKVRCEKYAIRKLIVSLRPVIDRFMALLECQLDNTLRSENYNKISMDPYYLYASKMYSNDDSRSKKTILPKNKLPRKNTERSRNTSPRKSQKMHRYDNSDRTDQDVFVRDDENRSPWVRKYGLDHMTRINSASRVVTSVKSNNKNKNKDNDSNSNNNEYLTNYNEYFQSPPLYDDYNVFFKIHSSHRNGLRSLVNPSISVNDDQNADVKLTNRNSALSAKEESNENQRTDAFYDEDVPEEAKYIFNKSDWHADPNGTDASFVPDFIKIRNDDQLLTDANLAKRQKTVKSFGSITEFLKSARDASMQTPEFAVSFALDSNKGYVELTHLIKHPKILMYRPQFIVKNTMPYDDFLKTVNNFNMTNDEVRLMKIVRHLPDNTVKVLFETDDFESPLEVRNIKDNRRSDLSNSLEWRTVTTNNNAKYNISDFSDEDSEGIVHLYQDDVHSNFADAIFEPDWSGSDEIPASNSNLETNSDTNSTSNSTLNSDSSLSSGLLPTLTSRFVVNIQDLGSGNGLVSAADSAVGSQTGSGTGLDTALNNDPAYDLKPKHQSHLGSFLSNFLPSHSHSQTNSKPNPTSHTQSLLYNQSDINSNSYSDSHSQPMSNSNSDSNSLSTTEHRNPTFKNSLPAKTQSIVNKWWKIWKNIFKGKIKKIVREMATLADNVDNIETL